MAIVGLLHPVLWAFITFIVAFSMVSATLYFWDLYKTYRLPVDVVCSAIPLICLAAYTVAVWPVKE